MKVSFHDFVCQIGGFDSENGFGFFWGNIVINVKNKVPNEIINTIKIKKSN